MDVTVFYTPGPARARLVGGAQDGAEVLINGDDVPPELCLSAVPDLADLIADPLTALAVDHYRLAGITDNGTRIYRWACQS